jgi:hypothetical protein
LVNHFGGDDVTLLDVYLVNTGETPGAASGQGNSYQAEDKDTHGDWLSLLWKGWHDTAHLITNTG